MLYEMRLYCKISDFNADAIRLNRLVKSDTPAPAERLWWKVEQMMFDSSGNILVLWSRPEPFKNR